MPQPPSHPARYALHPCPYRLPHSHQYPERLFADKPRIRLYLHQQVRITKRSQRDHLAGLDADAVYLQPQRSAVIPKQAKAVACIKQEDTWPIDGHHLRQLIGHGVRLTGTSRAEQQLVHVLCAVIFIQRIDTQWAAAAVKEGKTRIASAGIATVHRCQAGKVLDKHQARIPVIAILLWVKAHRLGTQVTTERPDIMFLVYRLQAAVQQFAADVEIAFVQRFRVLGPNQQRDSRAIDIDLMLVPQEGPRSGGILACA